MPSPFPGMNPYLEQALLWPEVHKWLVMLIAEAMNPKLRPQYWMAVKERVYQTTAGTALLVGIPDDVVVQEGAAPTPSSRTVAVAEPEVQPITVQPKIVQPTTVTLPMGETVKEWYLEVRAVSSNKAITAIELLSPKNKQPGKGRNQYERKRQQVLASLTHLIEIDLLRRGQPMPLSSNGMQSDYRILVSRSGARPQADLYGFNLRDRIPAFPLPLRPGDEEPAIDLQSLLDLAYERGSYDLRLDYGCDPKPTLSEKNATWLDRYLKDRGLRS